MTQVDRLLLKSLTTEKSSQYQKGCQTEWISGFIQSLQLSNSQGDVFWTIINS